MGNLGQDDPDAVRVLGPHLGQSPGPGDRFQGDRYSGRSQSGVFRADIPHLDPDHRRAPAGPDTLGSPWPGEKAVPRWPAGPDSLWMARPCASR